MTLHFTSLNFLDLTYWIIRLSVVVFNVLPLRGTAEAQ